MMISEYERQRQENIRRNQEILASLNIPKLGPPTTLVKKASTIKREKRETEEVLPMRKSSRIIEKLTGMKSPEPEIFREVVVKKERRIAPKMNLPYEPRNEVDDDLKELLRMKSEAKRGSNKYTNLQFQNERCLVKVAPDRIYSMGMLPVRDKVVAVAGTKFGSMMFWDATQVFTGEDVDALPKVWSFTPHPDESITNIKFSEGLLYTSAYDGSIKRLNSEYEFETMFESKKKDEWIICGMDVVSGNEFVMSDVEGRVGLLDWRNKDALVKEWNMKEKKIGCVSMSCDGRQLALSSNDGTVSVYDWRNLSPEKALKTFEYGRAVTSVYFHPNSPDYLVSTCYDDHVRVHHLKDDVVKEARHNNQTGRWITPFKAIWDPKSTSADDSRIIVGDMNRGLDIYDVTGGMLQNITSDYVTSQPAVSAAHSYHPIVISGNASGKLVMYYEV